MNRLILITFGLLAIAVGALNAQERESAAPAQAYPQAFTLPGVEFNAEQQSQVAELRKKYVPKFTEIQKRRSALLTPEQRQGWLDALTEARKAGKQGQELQAAVEQAIKLADEQKEKLAVIRQEQASLVAQAQGELRKILTPEQRRMAEQRRQGAGQRDLAPRIAPTHLNVKYGPHERNVMDAWLAKSDKPTPVLVSIHGGGFRGGNKSVDPTLLSECLKSGISVVAITYRFTDQAIAPAQFLDAARAVQFTRHQAKGWNLDAKRFAATGGSAGAGISLWLGFHDDLADPRSSDPVLRESTRLTCMSVYQGQSSYDPRFIRELFPDTDTYKHPALAQLYEVDLEKLDETSPEKLKLFEEASPLTHLTKDDAPAQLIYFTELDTPITNQGIGIHHPKFGQALKEKMDPLGIECEVHTGIRPAGDERTELTLRFIKKHLGIE